MIRRAWAYAWEVWAKALGEKASEDSRTSDLVALVRTVIVLVNVVCALFIMTNIVHNW